MTAKILITGASGYLGRNLVRDYVARGAKVDGLVRSDASAKIVEALGATPVRGDIMDPASLERAMAGISDLIHAAADTAHGRATKAQEMTNLQGTRHVYEAAKKAGVKRAVHISTEAVLMDGRPIIQADESWPIPAKSAGGYSRSKAGAERIALEANGDGLDVIVVRPRFVWGRDDTTALPQLVEAARTGKLAWIGGGLYLTSTTHIANVVEGVRLALEKGRGGEVYFVTDGEDIPFKPWITQLLATQGVEARAKDVPRWLIKLVVNMGDALASLTGGAISGPMSRQEYATVGVTVTLDISKARNELGYKPVITRVEGLQELTKP
ncbi:MAG: NAD-dependent epimerase/dehydratase family protein [Alphaproteobacteria bacterium]|nr:MAG: NAD-dependent epimerase/dehydratase family protein [Alphaproteobacteria bacterium]